MLLGTVPRLVGPRSREERVVGERRGPILLGCVGRKAVGLGRHDHVVDLDTRRRGRERLRVRERPDGDAVIERHVALRELESPEQVLRPVARRSPVGGARRARRLKRVRRALRRIRGCKRSTLDPLHLHRAACQRSLVEGVDLSTVERPAERVQIELVRRDVEAVPIGANERLIAEARAIGVGGPVRTVVGDVELVLPPVAPVRGRCR